MEALPPTPRDRQADEIPRRPRESGVIAQADIDSLAGEPTIADVNALLNSHPKVKNLELEKRDGDNARDARTYAQTRDDIEDDGYTPANYTRRR